MGCDIHFYTETRKDGAWISADTWKRHEPDEPGEPGDLYVEREIYDGRNYNLFAMLADVRNGSGFAGCRTGSGFNPIAAPRGVPNDANANYKEIVARWGADGHSHSHLTLRELLDYDWTQKSTLEGWIGFDEWSKWQGWGKRHGEHPSEWCGGVSGGTIVHLDVSEAAALLAKHRKLYEAVKTNSERTSLTEKLQKDTQRVFVHDTWDVTYAKAAGDFYASTIPQLLRMAGGTRGIDDVRILFFFDN